MRSTQQVACFCCVPAPLSSHPVPEHGLELHIITTTTATSTLKTQPSPGLSSTGLTPHSGLITLVLTVRPYFPVAQVVTDGARHVAAGGSPFARATYRYTPLLAWLMLPNIWVHPAAGKLLFCAADLVAAWWGARLPDQSVNAGQV